MNDLEQRFEEDKAMRDAAKAVLLADIEYVRESFSAKGIASRAAERVSDGAKDVFEIAKDRTDDHRGLIAALIGAIVLWLSREPIFAFLGLAEPEDAAVPEADAVESLSEAENLSAEEAVETLPDGDEDE